MCIILCLYAPLDPQHLSEGILIAMTHLKLLPGLPIGLGCPGIADLGAMAIDSASTLQLTKLGLQLSVLQTHMPVVGGDIYMCHVSKVNKILKKHKCIVHIEEDYIKINNDIYQLMT